MVRRHDPKLSQTFFENSADLQIYTIGNDLTEAMLLQ
jgi:hypothetical protein